MWSIYYIIFNEILLTTMISWEGKSKYGTLTKGELSCNNNLYSSHDREVTCLDKLSLNTQNIISSLQW